jgi:vacuolar protein sorting-associated protein 13A/C
MFESLVAGLLNRFVGPYVTNLNVNQLNIGIWNGRVLGLWRYCWGVRDPPPRVVLTGCLVLFYRPGDVKLTNLRLKKDALDKFNLPVDVIEGEQ